MGKESTQKGQTFQLGLNKEVDHITLFPLLKGTFKKKVKQENETELFALGNSGFTRVSDSLWSIDFWATLGSHLHSQTALGLFALGKRSVSL